MYVCMYVYAPTCNAMTVLSDSELLESLPDLRTVPRSNDPVCVCVCV